MDLAADLMELILETFSEISFGPMKGANIRKSVRITFEEAVHGCEKELELVLKDPCEDCHGTGAKPGTSPETCPKCGGKGSDCLYIPVFLWYCTECADLSDLWRFRKS